VNSGPFGDDLEARITGRRAPSCSCLLITKGRAPLVVMLHEIRRLRKVRPRMLYLMGDSAHQIVLNSETPHDMRMVLHESDSSTLKESVDSLGTMLRWSDLPTNLETPFDQVDTFLTPTELFYIRNHFQAPQLDLASYQLRIDGAVRNPFSLSYKELPDMPSETRVATLECAGNGRVFLIPQVEGAQWELGAVGNAEWTGVPLGHRA